MRLTSYNYDLNSNVIKRIQDQTEGTAGSGHTSYFTYNRANWLELQEVYGDKSFFANENGIWRQCSSGPLLPHRGFHEPEAVGSERIRQCP